MSDNIVTVSRAGGESRLAFSPVFNVAVPFIDRHLEEGRASKVAIRGADGETVSYGQLAERVNRCGNALKGLGIAPGARLLMMGKDCPALFYRSEEHTAEIQAH